MSTLSRDGRNTPMAMLNLSAGINRGLSLTSGGAAVQTAAFGDRARAIETAVLVMCEGATWVKAALNPTAAIDPATSTLLAPGIPYYFTITAGHKLSAILNTGETDSAISITDFV